MNEKEIGEIRRRFRPDKSNISHVCGCYVNEKGEIVSQFEQPLSMLPQEETEKLLSLLKRTLSGTLGKNLMDLEFSTAQVVSSEEHKLLMALRGSGLKDLDAVNELYQKIISSVSMEETYLILLAAEQYDVPYRSKDGEVQEDASDTVYSYILCSICPVKITKSALCYDVPENTFRSMRSDWLISYPEAGFLFPSFDDRSANIYNALYYSRNTAVLQEEMIRTVFNTPVPTPAQVQKETFESVLSETLEEDCSLDVVQAVHAQLCEMMEDHKEKKEEAPLMISKETVKSMLHANGVSPSRTAAFDEKYDEAFGAETRLSPANVVDQKKFTVKTQDVTIQVSPDRSDLIETKIINGTKYIMIRAEGEISVNGVDIRVSE